MARLSKSIAIDINNYDLALTQISTNFGDGNNSNGKGCCDADYIDDARKNRFNEICSNNQNHYKNKQSRHQNNENINFKKNIDCKIFGGGKWKD
jgi:hypothetical protein